MSLTSQLDSPIRKFLEERFPNTRAVTSEANAQFRKVETIRPSEQRMPLEFLCKAVA